MSWRTRWRESDCDAVEKRTPAYLPQAVSSKAGGLWPIEQGRRTWYGPNFGLGSGLHSKSKDGPPEEFEHKLINDLFSLIAALPLFFCS